MSEPPKLPDIVEVVARAIYAIDPAANGYSFDEDAESWREMARVAIDEIERRSPAPAETNAQLREALVRIEIITASGRTDELLGKMKTINSLAHSALSSRRDGGKP